MRTVRLDLTNTAGDFPEIVGWYWWDGDKWRGPYEELSDAAEESAGKRAYIRIDVVEGFQEF